MKANLKDFNTLKDFTEIIIDGIKSLNGYTSKCPIYHQKVNGFDQFKINDKCLSINFYHGCHGDYIHASIWNNKAGGFRFGKISDVTIIESIDQLYIELVELDNYLTLMIHKYYKWNKDLNKYELKESA